MKDFFSFKYETQEQYTLLSAQDTFMNMIWKYYSKSITVWKFCLRNYAESFLWLFEIGNLKIKNQYQFIVK